MRILLLLSVMMVPGCRGGSRDPAESESRFPTRTVFLLAADLQAYRAGRQQEIEALREGSPVTPEALDSLGALAAGISLESYRQVTQEVDQYLKEGVSRIGSDSLTRKATFDSNFAELDSLRVERLVLGVRSGE
jgi:hypothetical protein